MPPAVPTFTTVTKSVPLPDWDDDDVLAARVKGAGAGYRLLVPALTFKIVRKEIR